MQSAYGWNMEMEQTLPEKIREDLKTAVRNRDAVVRDTLRQIMAEYPGLTVPIRLESGKKTTRPKRAEEITSEDVIEIIRRLVKSERTVLEAKGQPTSEYLQTLERYLPKTADREEIEAWINANIDFSRYKSPMQAMGDIMKHFGKRADGSQVKQVLQEIAR